MRERERIADTRIRFVFIFVLFYVCQIIVAYVYRLFGVYIIYRYILFRNETRQILITIRLDRIRLVRKVKQKKKRKIIVRNLGIRIL